MRTWKLIVLLSAVLAASCAHDRGRPGVAARTYDCYDWWPYVYSAPVDCFYGPSAFYDPAYYYYRPYPVYGVPVASAPSAAVPSAKDARPRARLLPRERRPLEAPAADLPVPVLRPPRTLP
jgi:hypothetical protein